jgi:hypothetical protein
LTMCRAARPRRRGDRRRRDAAARATVPVFTPGPLRLRTRRDRPRHGRLGRARRSTAIGGRSGGPLTAAPALPTADRNSAQPWNSHLSQRACNERRDQCEFGGYGKRPHCRDMRGIENGIGVARLNSAKSPYKKQGSLACRSSDLDLHFAAKAAIYSCIITDVLRA